MLIRNDPISAQCDISAKKRDILSNCLWRFQLHALNKITINYHLNEFQMNFGEKEDGVNEFGIDQSVLMPSPSKNNVLSCVNTFPDKPNGPNGFLNLPTLFLYLNVTKRLLNPATCYFLWLNPFWGEAFSIRVRHSRAPSASG